MDLTPTTHLAHLRAAIIEALAATRAYNAAADTLNALCASSGGCYRVNPRYRGDDSISLKSSRDVVKAVISRWRNAVAWEASEAFAEGTGAALNIEALPWLGIDCHPDQERNYDLSRAVRKALAAFDADAGLTDPDGCVDTLLALLPVASFLNAVQTAAAGLRAQGLRALANTINGSLWLASSESRRRLKLRGRRYELTISNGYHSTTMDQLATLNRTLKQIEPHCGHQFAMTGLIDEVLGKRPVAGDTVRLGDMAVRVYQQHVVVVLPPADAEVMVAFVASHVSEVAAAMTGEAA